MAHEYTTRDMIQDLLSPQHKLDVPAYIRIYVIGHGLIDLPINQAIPGVGPIADIYPNDALPFAEFEVDAAVTLAAMLIEAVHAADVSGEAMRRLDRAIADTGATVLRSLDK